MGLPEAMAPVMDTTKAYIPRLTSTQKGAIGEAIVGAQLILASGGRLSPHRPLADDDGTDLLLADKVSGRFSMLQIKCRFISRSEGTKYEQFDLRLKTFREVAHNWVLAAMIDPADGVLWCSWLIPATELMSIASQKGDLLVIRPNPVGLRDRYVPWRLDSVAALAERLTYQD